MFSITNLKELSFLVYGLGLSGQSVVKFFKKNNIVNYKVWDDKQKKLFKNKRTKNLKETLVNVDYIVLSPGINSDKNKASKAAVAKLPCVEIEEKHCKDKDEAIQGKI